MVTRKAGRLAVLVSLILPAAAQPQPSADLWRFAHPNAQALISINWQRVRQSPAVKILRDQWLKSGVAAPAIPGIDLLDDIDRVLISSPGAQDESAEAPMLLAVHGHFDPAKIHQLFAQLGAKPQRYNSFQVYRPQGEGAKDTAYVMFDADTLLFGDAPSIFAALERNRFSPAAPEPGSIVAQAAELEDKYDFWLSMKNPDLLSSDRLGDLFRAGGLASDSQGFEAGLNLRSGLDADLTLHFGSDASAARVVAEMAHWISAAAKDKSADPQVREMERKLKFTADGAAARINLHLSAEELEKSARVLVKSNAAGFMAARSAPGLAPIPPPAPVPAKPATIRIEGLDDGPREIPYDSH